MLPNEEFQIRRNSIFDLRSFLFRFPERHRLNSKRYNGDPYNNRFSTDGKGLLLGLVRRGTSVTGDVAREATQARELRIGRLLKKRGRCDGYDAASMNDAKPKKPNTWLARQSAKLAARTREQADASGAKARQPVAETAERVTSVLCDAYHSRLPPYMPP